MLWIKNAQLMDPKTGKDALCDIGIENGKVAVIAKAGTVSIMAEEACIDATGMIAAPGLIDVHVHFRDPGFTYKEDVSTGAAASAAGGYTTVICMANTNPKVDNPETFLELRKKAEGQPVHVLNTAAITTDFNGRDLVDMDLLKSLGAVGFTDDGVPLKDAAIVKKAMEKAAQLDLPLSFHEEDPSLIGSYGINQGKISEAVGVDGAPGIAEDALVARDCAMALSTGASIDIQHISSGRSVDIVRAMKAMGGHIYAEATPQHFSLTEDIVLEKGTLAKVNPPLRTEADKKAIIEGLKDDTIDFIATDHAPHASEEKAKSMKDAPSGMIGLETALALAITNLVKPGHLDMMHMLKKLTVNPAAFYHLDAGYIAEGHTADIVLFDPFETWTVTTDCFRSKSCNSPFIGMELTGRVKYTICDGNIVYKG